MMKSVSSTWGVTLALTVAAYVLTPYTLHRLGDAGYGTWSLINAITGYLALLALGVPMASVRYFAVHVADHDVEKLNEAVGSCTALYLALGAAALVIGGGMFVFFTGAYDLPAVLRTDARWAFAVTVVFVAVGFIGMLPNGLLQAHDDFAPRNAIKFAGVVLRLLLTLALLWWWPSLTAVAVIQLACLVFDFAVCLWFIRRRYPDVRIRLADFDWSMARKIFSFSMFVLILNAGARLSFETDSIVIGKFQNVSAIPYFTVGNSFVLYLMDFLLAIAAVVMPMATRLKTQGRSAELREIFLKWSKIALSVSMLAGLFLVVLGPRFIAWWIDPTFEVPAGQVLQILMISYLVFLPIRAVALPILMGLGKPGLPTIGFLVTGVMNLGLSIALARPFGLAGVAIGTAVPNVLFAGAVLWQACRELEMPLGAWLHYVVPRAAVGAIPVLALLFWLRDAADVRTLPALVAAGVAMLVVFALVWVFFVYRSDPYLDLRSRLVALRPRAAVEAGDPA
jgi:O-antigen/teichoic acid export membrane protein